MQYRRYDDNPSHFGDSLWSKYATFTSLCSYLPFYMYVYVWTYHLQHSCTQYVIYICRCFCYINECLCQRGEFRFSIHAYLHHGFHNFHIHCLHPSCHWRQRSTAHCSRCINAARPWSSCQRSHSSCLNVRIGTKPSTVDRHTNISTELKPAAVRCGEECPVPRCFFTHPHCGWIQLLNKEIRGIL